MSPSAINQPVRAATETAQMYGITADRCDILQNGNTLVVRLTETLVARVVQDVDGPRHGMEWFSRETAMAQHLAARGAGIIPLHPGLPPGPHEHLGYTLNFWLYVTAIETPADAVAIGTTLCRCHDILRSFPQALPELAILTESLELLETLKKRELFPAATLQLLRGHLVESVDILRTFPHQPLHGDAHVGNLMNTTIGLLWTDWEDTFLGPVEWDLASVIWNAQILEQDHQTVSQIMEGYRRAGGVVNQQALHQSLVARAAVMTAWYPILYPNPSGERLAKLQRRLDWLEAVRR